MRRGKVLGLQREGREPDVFRGGMNRVEWIDGVQMN